VVDRGSPVCQNADARPQTAGESPDAGTRHDSKHLRGEVTREAGYAATTETGPLRDALIKKGIIYSPRHGEIAFTAPHFADFMRRTFPASAA
jgi:hypothetical protein